MSMYGYVAASFSTILNCHTMAGALSIITLDASFLSAYFLLTAAVFNGLEQKEANKMDMHISSRECTVTSNGYM